MNSDDARPGRGSWRIVWRALRVGQVDDVRYAALTRQTANGTVRNGWLPVLFIVACTIQLCLVVVHLTRGADLFGTAATAGSALFIAFGAYLTCVARRRSKRYLANVDVRPPSRSR